MTWASHIMVGASVAKVFGLSYVLTTLGAVLPDLVEILSKKMQHRGISHSVAISLVALVLMWSTPFRDAWIGVVFGHLLMDSLTMMGVPVLDERSRRLTIFGGKLRTGSPGEFVVSGIIAFVAFVMLGSFGLDFERRDWAKLHHQGVVDRREYYDNRFKFF
jgi:inner membrane protein